MPNPSLDLTLRLNQLKTGCINKSIGSTLCAAGKGANVAIVLKRHQVSANLYTFLGGQTGHLYQQLIQAEKLNFIDVAIENQTRINVKIRDYDETDINQGGPEIYPDAQEKLLEHVRKRIDKEDYVALCGSFPPGIDTTFVQKLHTLAKDKQAKLVVDTNSLERGVLMQVFPWLIKPNEEELAAYLGHQCDLNRLDQATLRQIRSLAKNVLISRGKQGALYITAKDCWKISVPVVHAVNTVGAGDAMLAGGLAAAVQQKTLEQMLAIAAASGTACAMKEGLPSYEDIEALIKQIKIEKI